VSVGLDYQKFAEEDLWSLTDLRFALFCKTYSSRYWPNLYQTKTKNEEKAKVKARERKKVTISNQLTQYCEPDLKIK
jgi:hypothetical protein